MFKDPRSFPDASALAEYAHTVREEYRIFTSLCRTHANTLRMRAKRAATPKVPKLPAGYTMHEITINGEKRMVALAPDSPLLTGDSNLRSSRG
jgi:hypothetical protein